MSVSYILHGLERVPATLAVDDPRLPGIVLGATPLRLHTVPLPREAWGASETGHAARMDAIRTWLLAGCGDYNGALRRGVGRYLDAVEAHVADHLDELSTRLARFQGLYQEADWCWSALRPLPRAWWRQDGVWRRADLAFWDGNEVIASGSRDFDAGALPPAFRHFWLGEILPVSPFRRALPEAISSVPQTVISST